MLARRKSLRGKKGNYQIASEDTETTIDAKGGDTGAGVGAGTGDHIVGIGTVVRTGKDEIAEGLGGIAAGVMRAVSVEEGTEAVSLAGDIGHDPETTTNGAAARGTVGVSSGGRS